MPGQAPLPSGLPLALGGAGQTPRASPEGLGLSFCSFCRS